MEESWTADTTEQEPQELSYMIDDGGVAALIQLVSEHKVCWGESYLGRASRSHVHYSRPARYIHRHLPGGKCAARAQRKQQESR